MYFIFNILRRMAPIYFLDRNGFDDFNAKTSKYLDKNSQYKPW